jgi:hypothetical protein
MRAAAQWASAGMGSFGHMDSKAMPIRIMGLCFRGLRLRGGGTQMPPQDRSLFPFRSFASSGFSSSHWDQLESGTFMDRYMFGFIAFDEILRRFL